MRRECAPLRTIEHFRSRAKMLYQISPQLLEMAIRQAKDKLIPAREKARSQLITAPRINFSALSEEAKNVIAQCNRDIDVLVARITELASILNGCKKNSAQENYVLLKTIRQVEELLSNKDSGLEPFPPRKCKV